MDAFWYLVIGMLVGFGFGAMFARMMIYAHLSREQDPEDPYNWT
jgi:hypothetical protein